MKRIIHWFFQQFEKEIEFIVRNATSEARYDIKHDLLASMGIEHLEKIIEQGKRNRETEGQSNYTNLAKMYGEMMNQFYEEKTKQLELEVETLKKELEKHG